MDDCGGSVLSARTLIAQMQNLAEFVDRVGGIVDTSCVDNSAAKFSVAGAIASNGRNSAYSAKAFAIT